MCRPFLGLIAVLAIASHCFAQGPFQRLLQRNNQSCKDGVCTLPKSVDPYFDESVPILAPAPIIHSEMTGLDSEPVEIVPNPVPDPIPNYGYIVDRFEPVAEPKTTFVLEPLSDPVDLTTPQVVEADNTEDRMDRVVRATVRISVSGSCGSGTIVGRDKAGNSLILTNAHVAGSRKGRTVSCERWNIDGTSERGKGTIVSAGYSSGLSLDFALLRCSTGFGSDVTPIPLAERYPDDSNGVITYGCPRCEWPSMQALKVYKGSGQILKWYPGAIGGRSGSSLVDFVDGEPRVVGLLTWRSNDRGKNNGMGQSIPFILDALKGREPTAYEALPSGAVEVSTGAKQAICLLDGSDPPWRVCDGSGVIESVGSPIGAVLVSQVETGLVDQITEPKPPKAKPITDGDESGLIDRIKERRKPELDEDEAALLRPDNKTVINNGESWPFVRKLAILIAGVVFGFVLCTYRVARA